MPGAVNNVRLISIMILKPQRLHVGVQTQQLRSKECLLNTQSEDQLIYYITIVVYNRLQIFTSPSFIIPLIDSLNFYRYNLDFKILGYVIMPDHVHLIIWPQGAATISDIMRDFKTFTSKRIINQAKAEKRKDWVQAFQLAGEQTGRSKNKVWQDAYWDKIIFTQKFLQQKLDYMHLNPVRAGLVNDLAAYPYSSYRNYEYEEEWFIKIDHDWLA